MTKNRNTRALIRIAARKEFGKHGFSGARVNRIATEAGVNKQLIFYYFQSKQGLYNTVSHNASVELASVVADTVAGADQFRIAFAAVFETLAAAPDLTALILQSAQGSSETPAVTALIDAFTRVISNGQSLGHYRDDVDPGFFSRHAVAVLLGYFAIARAVWSDSKYQPEVWLREITSSLASRLTW